MKIIVTTREKEVADQAISALSQNKNIFKRSGSLVRILRDQGSKMAGVTREIGTPIIQNLPQASLRESLTEDIEWVKLRTTKQESIETPVHPPDWVIQAIDARDDWPSIPHLEAIVEAPILRPDGSIIQETGYDDKTGLYYEPNGHFEKIKSITSQDIKHALDLLLEVVCDFPFSKNCHRSAWLAGLLTPFAKFAFVGPSPLFLVDGNVQASGKSKLADTAGLIFSGRTLGRVSQSSNEDEENKKITSIAYQGDSLVLIDNISRPFGNSELAAALTTTQWQGRLLGTNKMPVLPLFVQWWATGNNVQFSNTDIARRTLHIRLDSLEENPEMRTNLKHPELLDWVKENRSSLVKAALTLLAGYVQAGKPEMLEKHLGSFTGWSRLICNCLVWAGLENPLLAYEQMKVEEDTEKSLLAEILFAWEEMCKDQNRDSCTIREVLDFLEEDRVAKTESSTYKFRYERLYNALVELVPGKPGRLPDAIKVGKIFRQYRNRVVQGRRLERVGEKTNKGQLWSVKKIDRIKTYGNESTTLER